VAGRDRQNIVAHEWLHGWPKRLPWSGPSPPTRACPHSATATTRRPLYQEQQCSDRTTNTEDHCSSLSRPSSSHLAVTTSHPEALSPLANMLVLFSLLTLFGTLSSLTSATALTYKLTPNEKECFYTHVVKQGAKVAFYFAVQSGGSFDSGLH
jgi:hypothetical protein